MVLRRSLAIASGVLFFSLTLSVFADHPVRRSRNPEQESTRLRRLAHETASAGDPDAHLLKLTRSSDKLERCAAVLAIEDHLPTFSPGVIRTTTYSLLHDSNEEVRESMLSAIESFSHFPGAMKKFRGFVDPFESALDSAKARFLDRNRVSQILERLRNDQ